MRTRLPIAAPTSILAALLVAGGSFALAPTASASTATLGSLPGSVTNGETLGSFQSLSVPIGSLGSLAATSGSASAGAHEEPPYIESALWTETIGVGERELWITPTDAGRITQGPADEQAAWDEVLAFAPDADTPGMRAQFTCHWVFARAVEPDKPTWNLEPWRPVVTDVEMITARCNPVEGGSLGS